jgi:uncharacterized protein (DUF3084 family)
MSLWPGWRAIAGSGIVVLAWTALLSLLGLDPKEAAGAAVVAFTGMCCPLAALGVMLLANDNVREGIRKELRRELEQEKEDG